MVEKQGAAKPVRRMMKVFLVASLGLNVLIIGLVGGAVFRGGPPDQIRLDRDVSVLGLRAYYLALDDSARKGLREGIHANRGQIRVGRGVFRAHLKALSDALAAEPYDGAAVNSVLTGQANAVAVNISVGHRLLLEQISEMAPEARKEMAARLLKPRRRPENSP